MIISLDVIRIFFVESHTHTQNSAISWQSISIWKYSKILYLSLRRLDGADDCKQVINDDNNNNYNKKYQIVGKTIEG